MADVSSITAGYEVVAQEGFSDTLNGTVSSGAATVTLNSTSGYSDGDKVIFTVDRVDSSAVATPAKEQSFYGEISGSSIINVVWTEGSNQSHADGAVVEDLVTATHHLVNNKWVKQFADEDGALDSDAVRTALNLGNESNNGWAVEAETPNTVTNNGNRSYDLVFNSTDLTDTLSPGMRFRTTRTTAAPDQCADLERGSSQYFSATTPGYSFTDDFVVTAWVKLESYASAAIQGIASVYNGTSGFALLVNTDGTIRLQGNNAGSGNVSYVDSYQSIPLGRWVHIAAQLDMSSFTTTTTTSYVMLDGVDVPANVARAGTNPTTIVQAGNLEIGAYNGGTNPLDGKIAQVGIFNAKVTQATIQDYMTHGLDGSETNNDGAWSLDNVITDLNSNANDLTANGGAVATDTDSPFGNGGVSTTLDYGIVTAVDYSTNTTVTVQVPEGCTIDTSGGISAVAYSTNSTPYGFVRDSGRWRVEYYQIASYTSGSASSTVWLALIPELSIPVGAWRYGYSVNFQENAGGVAGSQALVSIESSQPANGNYKGKTIAQIYDASAQYTAGACVGSNDVELAAATTYTLYGAYKQGTATVTFTIGNNAQPTILYADCAYL